MIVEFLALIQYLENTSIFDTCEIITTTLREMFSIKAKHNKACVLCVKQNII